MHSGLKIPRKHLEISTKSNEMDYSQHSDFIYKTALERSLLS